MSAYFLKKPDNSTYGPVELTDLRSWAAEGRVAPGDMVSPDRKAWHPAPSVDELGMKWIIDLRGGETVGPVHIKAIADLIKQGKIDETHAVTHSASGEVTTVAEALESEEQSKSTEPKSAETKSGEPERAKLPVREKKVKKAASTEPPHEAAKTDDPLDGIAADDTVVMELPTPAAENMEDALSELVDQLRAQLKGAEDELAASKERTADVQKELAASEVRLTDTQAELADVRETLAAERAEPVEVKSVFTPHEAGAEEVAALEHKLDLAEQEKAHLKEEIARLRERVNAVSSWKDEGGSRQSESSPSSTPVSDAIQEHVVKAASAQSKSRAATAARKAARDKLTQKIARSRAKSSGPKIRRGPTSRY